MFKPITVTVVHADGTDELPVNVEFDNNDTETRIGNQPRLAISTTLHGGGVVTVGDYDLTKVESVTVVEGAPVEVAA